MRKTTPQACRRARGVRSGRSVSQRLRSSVRSSTRDVARETAEATAGIKPAKTAGGVWVISIRSERDEHLTLHRQRWRHAPEVSQPRQAAIGLRPHRPPTRRSSARSLERSAARPSTSQGVDHQEPGKGHQDRAASLRHGDELDGRVLVHDQPLLDVEGFLGERSYPPIVPACAVSGSLRSAPVVNRVMLTGEMSIPVVRPSRMSSAMSRPVAGLCWNPWPENPAAT